LIEDGDLLFASSGNSWGKTTFFENPGYRVIVNTSTIRMRFWLKECSNKYLRYFLDCNIFTDQMLTQLQGMQPNFGSSHLVKVLLPLPPLAEQKRIVEKCDRLLILCDEIEKRQQQRQASLLKMNEGAISQLLTAQTPDDFQHYWQGICNNFDLLYSIPETIPKLRQAILQLAMQGMFISEKTEDEHSANSQSKKVSDFVKVLNGYAFKSEWFIDDGIRLLRNANVGHGSLRWDDSARIAPERALEFQRFKLDEGDIVISLDRPLINTGLKLAKVTRKDLPCLLLQRVGKFDFKTNEIDPD
jgi:type I restriction enzyme S subunit